MNYRKRIRALTGGVAVLVLLGLISADTLFAGVTLTLADKALLVSLVSALLGIDIALTQAPISLQLDTSADSGDGDTGNED